MVFHISSLAFFGKCAIIIFVVLLSIPCPQEVLALHGAEALFFLQGDAGYMGLFVLTDGSAFNQPSPVVNVIEIGGIDA